MVVANTPICICDYELDIVSGFTYNAQHIRTGGGNGAHNNMHP